MLKRVNSGLDARSRTFSTEVMDCDSSPRFVYRIDCRCKLGSRVIQLVAAPVWTQTLFRHEVIARGGGPIGEDFHPARTCFYLLKSDFGQVLWRRHDRPRRLEVLWCYVATRWNDTRQALYRNEYRWLCFKEAHIAQ